MKSEVIQEGRTFLFVGQNRIHRRSGLRNKAAPKVAMTRSVSGIHKSLTTFQAACQQKSTTYHWKPTPVDVIASIPDIQCDLGSELCILILRIFCAGLTESLKENQHISSYQFFICPQ